MKIYRYIYLENNQDNEKIKIKDYECVLSYSKNGYVVYGTYMKYISKEELEILRRDSEMWCLSNEKQNLFLELLIASDTLKLMALEDKKNIIKKQIEALEGLKINVD